MDRRKLLRLLAGVSAISSLSRLPGYAQTSSTRLSPEDSAFLDDLQRRGCLYFLEQASDVTGQVLDRAAANNTTGKRDPRSMASIASTGFGLTALCIAANRGYIPRERVLARVRNTLRFHLEKMEHVHGFLSHFNDVDNGYPYRGSEISPIDTSLFLCGVLTARQYFHADVEIVRMATAFYNRVEWPWMLNGGDTFAMGYRADAFLKSRWNHYCELMMLNLLGIGSPTHPIPPECWDAWTRPKMSFGGFEFISGADPLFVHQYSHAWFDFRNKHDRFADYFANSILATRAHKAWCLSLGRPYSEEYWGISASDSARGYQAWGGPPGEGSIDGSVVPYATAGSLPFQPVDCLRVLRSLKEKYGKAAYGRYGFCDALHPDANWYDADVLGIDVGLTVIMAENLRTGFVWETFKKNPEVNRAFDLAGFRAT